MVDIAELVVPIERRAHANVPATHALVIGVSQYRHLAGGPLENDTGRAWQMGQLSCAAGSATAIAAWLAHSYYNPQAPLRSLRVLISPSPEDTLDTLIAPYVNDVAHRAERDNVERAFADFLEDCASDPGNVAFVYVAGHGVQLTKHDAIVLLEDIAAPKNQSLRGAINVTDCQRGMDGEEMAGTQFWFIDACRQPPEIAAKFATMKGAFEIDELNGNAQSSQCYLSTSTLKESFGVPGARTLFCEALLKCLDGEAVSPPTPPLADIWHVSSNSLSQALAKKVRMLADDHGEVQTVHHFTRGRSSQAVLHQLTRCPVVELTIRLAPAEAAPVTTASVFCETGAPVPDVPIDWPLTMKLDAGLYSLQLTTERPYRPVNRPINLRPPCEEIEATVEP